MCEFQLALADVEVARRSADDASRDASAAIARARIALVAYLWAMRNGAF